jgi:hypothetical protein
MLDQLIDKHLPRLGALDGSVEFNSTLDDPKSPAAHERDAFPL